MEVFHGHGSPAVRAGNRNTCLQGDQGRCRVRGMHDEAVLAAEDAVVRVLALDGVALVPALAQAMEFSPVVPAAGLLAEVAPDGPLVAQLGARHLGGRHRQRPVLRSDDRVAGDFRNGGQGPDPKPSCRCCLDAPEFLEPGDADDGGDAKNTVAQASEQVGSAGVGSGAVQRKVADGFIE